VVEVTATNARTARSKGKTGSATAAKSKRFERKYFFLSSAIDSRTKYSIANKSQTTIKTHRQINRIAGESSGLMIGSAYAAKNKIPMVCRNLGEFFAHHSMARFIFTPVLDLFDSQNICIVSSFALRQVGFVRYAFKL
jgi:hypothetical protein